MSLKTFFSGWVIFFAGFAPAYAQQSDPIQNTDWYESFFLPKSARSVEKELQAIQPRLEEAINIHDLEVAARLQKEAGLLHLAHTHSYELAMDLFIQALTIEDSISLEKDQILTYVAIAQLFQETGDLFKSKELLRSALAINDRHRDVTTLVFLLNKLGKINAATGKIDEAFENFETAIRYKDEVGRPRMEAEALSNLAQLYTAQGKYDKALDTHKKALSIRRSIRDRQNEAHSLNDIGELYRLMKNDEKAIANHVVALEIRQALQDKRGLAVSYNNVGALYYQQKNFQRAIANLELALEAARNGQDQSQMRRSYDFLSQCYKELGDFRKALEYRDLFANINEFIQRDEDEQQLVERQNRYVMSQKQSQIEKLESIRKEREKELQTQKKFRNFLMALVALGIVVVLLVLYLYLVKRRANKKLKVANTQVQQQNIQLQDLNATKDKFFSIISHDLKGPLNSLTSFSSLLINHTDSLSKDEIKMLAKDLDKSLKNLFALLENLLEWSRSQTGNIEFKPEVFDFNALLEQNKGLLHTQALNKKITIENRSMGAVTVNAHKHSVNTVVRNLISNAIKFTPEGGTITLDALVGHEGDLVVSVKDTGVGMAPEVMQKLFRLDTKHTTKGTADEKGTGLGLILCKDFIEKNGGRIWVESTPGKGSIFYFSLPLPAPADRAQLQVLLQAG